MKVLRFKHVIFIIIIVVISFLFVHIVSAVTAEPGTEADPVVSQSYVDQKVTELTAKLDAANTAIGDLTKKISSLEAANEALSKQLKEVQPDAMKFQPVQLKAGQQLSAGESVEIILRSGKAKAIAGTYGGLSDITAASSEDIKTGVNIPLNHLLLVSRDDGRGITAVTDSWIIIKGTYTIK